MRGTSSRQESDARIFASSSYDPESRDRRFRVSDSRDQAQGLQLVYEIL